MEKVKLKYYVPEAKEFHEGFEFEFRKRHRCGLIAYIDANHTYTEEWYKYAFRKKETGNMYEKLLSLDFSAPLAISELACYIEDDALRVKYLDREDIEAVLKEGGWDVLDDNNSGGGFNARFLNECSVRIEAHHGKKPWIFIYKQGGKWGVEVEETRVLNQVSIKNKSEFKKLLRMIGIL